MYQGLVKKNSGNLEFKNLRYSHYHRFIDHSHSCLWVCPSVSSPSCGCLIKSFPCSVCMSISSDADVVGFFHPGKTTQVVLQSPHTVLFLSVSSHVQCLLDFSVFLWGTWSWDWHWIFWMFVCWLETSFESRAGFQTRASTEMVFFLKALPCGI